MITALEKKYTSTEYLDLEVQAESRNEYRNGAIIKMTGGTPTHNELVRSLTVLFSLALKGKPFQVFVTDQRLWIPDCRIYTYPDIMVLDKPIQLQDGRKDTVVNPILIAEVLSDSTEAYDRGDKFAAYRTIPSFQEYLLIGQHCLRVEQYAKQQTNQWLYSNYDGRDESFTLTSLGLGLVLAELFENVDFASESADSALVAGEEAN